MSPKHRISPCLPLAPGLTIVVSLTSARTNASYDLIDLFYFIGYLKSLQKNNVFYKYNYSQIPQLKDCFNETTELLLTSQPDPKIIIPHYRKLETQIKNSLFEHKQTLLNNFSAKIEANFNDTMSDVIATLKECDPNFDEEEFLRNITGK